jgi:hypothetical protein
MITGSATGMLQSTKEATYRDHAMKNLDVLQSIEFGVVEVYRADRRSSTSTRKTPSTR